MESEQATEAPALVFCRVCHEDEHPSSFITPCACSGSMQYAHQNCIQDWINEKGDKVCEVCGSPYLGTYNDPPAHRRRHFDHPDPFDMDSVRDYLVEEEHQRECHMWSFSFITTVLCGMFLLQFPARWSFGGLFGSQKATGQHLPEETSEWSCSICTIIQVAFSKLMWVCSWLIPTLATTMLVGGISVLVYVFLPPFWFGTRRFLRKHFRLFPASLYQGMELGQRQRQDPSARRLL